MFPRGYFPAGYFAPRFFPGEALEEAERPVLTARLFGLDRIRILKRAVDR